MRIIGIGVVAAVSALLFGVGAPATAMAQSSMPPEAGRASLFGVHGAIDLRVEALAVPDAAVRRSARATVAILVRGRDFEELDADGQSTADPSRAQEVRLDAPIYGGMRPCAVTDQAIPPSSSAPCEDVKVGQPPVNRRTERRAMCPSERFREQRRYGWCSAVLVSASGILTAAHCLKDRKPEDLLVVADLWNDPAGTAIPLRMPGSDPRLRRVAAVRSDAAADLGAARLATPFDAERPVPLPAETSTAAGAGDAIYATGFPNGLPMKVAVGVVSAVAPQTFGANAPIFSGNSGGPVFDVVEHRLIGIVREGPPDWWESRDEQVDGLPCATSRCSQAAAHWRQYCVRRPEQVTHIHLLTQQLRDMLN